MLVDINPVPNKMMLLSTNPPLPMMPWGQRGVDYAVIALAVPVKRGSEPTRLSIRHNACIVYGKKKESERERTDKNITFSAVVSTQLRLL